MSGPESMTFFNRPYARLAALHIHYKNQTWNKLRAVSSFCICKKMPNTEMGISYCQPFPCSSAYSQKCWNAKLAVWLYLYVLFVLPYKGQTRWISLSPVHISSPSSHSPYLGSNTNDIVTIVSYYAKTVTSNTTLYCFMKKNNAQMELIHCVVVVVVVGQPFYFISFSKSRIPVRFSLTAFQHWCTQIFTFYNSTDSIITE